MLRVHPEALKRVAEAELTGPFLMELFNGLAAAANAYHSPMVQIHLEYQGPDDQVGPDDMIPVISLSLRPAKMPGEKESV